MDLIACDFVVMAIVVVTMTVVVLSHNIYGPKH